MSTVSETQVAAAAKVYSAKPAAIPSPAASQIELAVVSPLISCLSPSFRIVPRAPRTRWPDAIPWTMRLTSAGLIPHEPRPGNDEHRRAHRHHHVRFAVQPNGHEAVARSQARRRSLRQGRVGRYVVGKKKVPIKTLPT